jgi:hypothetical protein
MFQKTPGYVKPPQRAENVRIGRERAEEVGIAALSHLAEDEDRLERFLGATGVSPEQLRAEAGSPAMLAAVLGYLLEEESALLVFATNAGIAPDLVLPAHAVLTGRMTASAAPKPSKIMARR